MTVTDMVALWLLLFYRLCLHKTNNITKNFKYQKNIFSKLLLDEGQNAHCGSVFPSLVK